VYAVARRKLRDDSAAAAFGGKRTCGLVGLVVCWTLVGQDEQPFSSWIGIEWAKMHRSACRLGFGGATRDGPVGLGPVHDQTRCQGPGTLGA
jgi:hypothetical protein